MPSIAITGGIACGKSSVMTFLRRFQEQTPDDRHLFLSFFDADKEVASLLDYDPEVAQEMKDAFGTSIYDLSGKADRSQLRSLLLNSLKHKNQLETILHPRLRKKWYPQALAARESTITDAIFIADLPLLYENHLEDAFDRVIVVAASEETQRDRLVTQRHLPASTARQLIALQLPLVEKINRAHHVLWNDGTQEMLDAQLQLFLKSFLSLSEKNMR